MNLEPVVFDRFEATKKNLGSVLDKYRDLVVTDAKQAKKVRAGLNKLTKDIDDRKKELKKPYVDAYKGMEQQVNELKSMIHEVKEPIDAQIKTIEMGEKLRRETRVKDLIADMAFSYQIDPDKVEVKSKWLTKSISDIELKREISEQLTLMNRFSVGKLPDGINKQSGQFINDDGEIVYKYSVSLYVTDDELETVASCLDENEIHYMQNKEG
ncbi:DUF1351 domain-containing protein [Paucilactobacillus kaifaensis]|uniref:DUF1351 domain-containing protein n=1 Tax=Paucilactobacillus kaifaensis TaxID=2559921 RepID=UPI0010F513ED|nr:DUF1351 domain-containing protein [Paucilactobacillus kaifaensis]